MATVWHDVVNPKRTGKVSDWSYADQAIVLQKGKNFLENREASWYLRDMAGRCLQKLGKIPGGN